jgi:hypothetical protein
MLGIREGSIDAEGRVLGSVVVVGVRLMLGLMLGKDVGSTDTDGTILGENEGNELVEGIALGPLLGN